MEEEHWKEGGLYKDAENYLKLLSKTRYYFVLLQTTLKQVVLTQYPVLILFFWIDP